MPQIWPGDKQAYVSHVTHFGKFLSSQSDKDVLYTMQTYVFLSDDHQPSSTTNHASDRLFHGIAASRSAKRVLYPSSSVRHILPQLNPPHHQPG